MAPSDDDSDPKPLLPRLSRRAFFTGAGASALTATLAQTAAQAAANVAPPVLGPEPSTLQLNINGRPVSVQADPGTTLADLLRNQLGMTGTKVGCDRGACSACTVWLDGKVAASCMTLAFDARGRKVTTIEGLAKGDELHPVQRAFVENDALQCGFCTSGCALLARRSSSPCRGCRTRTAAHRSPRRRAAPGGAHPPGRAPRWW